MIKNEVFFQQLREITALPPAERHAAVAGLHTRALADYVARVRAIDGAHAQQTSSDGRTMIQVVGHIAEFERYLILAASEIMVGIRQPQIMKLAGYREADGRELKFASIDDFNAYQAEKHAQCGWPEIQALALRTAPMLHALFSNSAWVAPGLLEQTEPCHWKWPDGTALAMPCGWRLWMGTVKALAVDHTLDLEAAA